MSNIAKVGMSIIVHAFELCYFWDRNLARSSQPKFDAEKAKALIASLEAHKGFDTLQFHVIGTIATPEEIKRCVAERTAEYEKYKAGSKTGDPDALRRLIVFEAWFVDAKGKVKAPTYSGVTGNNRYFSLFEAAVKTVAGLEKGKRFEDSGFTDTINVQITEVGDDADRERIQLRENNNATTGKMELTEKDNVYSVRRLVSLGRMDQQEVREYLGASKGQKYWHFIQLASRLVSLNLVNRCFEYSPDVGVDGGYINWANIKYAELPNLNLRSDPDRLAAHNAKANAKGQANMVLTPLTEADVDKQFKDWTAGVGSSGGKKRLDDKKVKQMSEMNENPLIAQTAAAIVSGDTSKIETLMVFTPLVVAAKILMDKAPEQYAKVSEFVSELSKVTDAGVLDAAVKALASIPLVAVESVELPKKAKVAAKGK